MTIIGIDFSILYPSICICKDFKEFKWLSIINTKLSKKGRENIESIIYDKPNLFIFETKSQRVKSTEYHLTDRSKLTNYIELINLIIEKIKDICSGEKDFIVAIEGISFGSGGNALVDISQSTGMLKMKIVEEILGGNSDRLFVFSPSELKNTIGCKGNANKFDIYTKFRQDPILESVKSSDLFSIATIENFIVKDQLVLSPFMDMIDSYLGVLKIYNLLK
jgi:hypothetical protein